MILAIKGARKQANQQQDKEMKKRAMSGKEDKEQEEQHHQHRQQYTQRFPSAVASASSPSSSASHPLSTTSLTVTGSSRPSLMGTLTPSTSTNYASSRRSSATTQTVVPIPPNHIL